MNYSLSPKGTIVANWILKNNIEIQNNLSAQAGTTNSKEEALLSAAIITSALLSERIVSQEYPGLESVYLNIDVEAVHNIRKANDEQTLYEAMNNIKFKRYASSLKVEEILNKYERQREIEEKNNMEIPTTNSQSDNHYKGFDDGVSEREQTINRYHPGFNGVNTNNKNAYYKNNLQEGPYDNIKNNYEANNVYEYGLNHTINGVKTITNRLLDGNFSFQMVIPVGYKGSTQAVNKKILTREEHDAFINKHMDDIFGLEKVNAYDMQNKYNYVNQYDFEKELG